MKIYMIRHGKADYSYCDSHNFIGHGNDLAPLSENNISDVVNMSKDKRLKEASIIVSSPYTRALQTASIISKEIGLDIKIEPDLSERKLKKHDIDYIILLHVLEGQGIICL